MTRPWDVDLERKLVLERAFDGDPDPPGWYLLGCVRYPDPPTFARVHLHHTEPRPAFEPDYGPNAYTFYLNVPLDGDIPWESF